MNNEQHLSVLLEKDNETYLESYSAILKTKIIVSLAHCNISLTIEKRIDLCPIAYTSIL